MDIYTTIELGIVIIKGIKDKKRIKSKGLIKRGSEWPE